MAEGSAERRGQTGFLISPQVCAEDMALHPGVWVERRMQGEAEGEFSEMQSTHSFQQKWDAWQDHED